MILACFTQAQNMFYIVEFNIADSTNNLPVKKASIIIPSIEKESKSNKNGMVKMGLSGGDYLVYIQAYGYNVKSGYINISSDTSIHFSLYPVYKSISIDEVLVYSDLLDKTRDISTGRENIRMKDVQQFPVLAGEQDVVKLLSTKTGVASGSEGSADMMVRGGTSDQNLFLIDENTIYKSTHLFGFFSSVNPLSLANVDFYKTSFPAQYGGKISSVVDVETKAPNKDSLVLNAELSLISGKVFLDVPLIKNKTGISLSARSTWIDKGLDLIVNDNSVSNLGFSDFQAKIDHKINSTSEIVINLYRDKDYWRFGDIDNSTNVEWKNRFGSLQYHNNLSDDVHLNVFAGASNYLFKVGVYEAKSGYEQVLKDELTSSLTDYNIKAILEKKESDRNLFQFGLQLNKYNVSPLNFSLFEVDTTYTSGIVDKGYFEFSTFFSGKYSLSKKIDVQTGLRFNSAFIDQNSDFSLEPRLNSSYKINNTNILKASVSKSWQPMHVLTTMGSGLSLNIHWPFSEQFKPETSWQYTLAYSNKRYIEGQPVVFTVGGYYKTMKNIINYKPGYDAVSLVYYRDKNPEDYITQGRGVSYGMELSLEAPIGRLNGWLSYTLSNTLSQFDEINNGEVYFAKNHRPHNFSLVLNYELNKKNRISTNFQYMTGSRVTLPEYIYFGTDYDFMNENITKVANDDVLFVSNGVINQYKMPDFHKLDVSYTHKFEKKRFKGEWSFSIYNVYNRKNAYYYFSAINDEVVRNSDGEIEYRTGNLIPQIKTVSMMPIIPSVSIRIEF
jgi:hypothetical protein